MVKEEKLKKVEELKKSLEESPVIGLVDMYKMPSEQLQKIRKALRGKADIKTIKKIILKFAIDRVDKENIKELEPHIPTQPAVALTNIEAFKFYSFVDSLKFRTFAKEGDVANEDIWVSAGPTHLMAGPVISELQQAGVPSSIESGRITIRRNKCIVRRGESISSIKANVMRKLKIKPMEVTLNIVTIYDNGNIYTKEVLDFTKTFPQMLIKAFNNALNLSVFIVFPTKGNINHLIARAAREANTIKELVDKSNDSNDKINSKPKEEHGGAS